MPDWQLAQLVAGLVAIPKIREVHLVRMAIGPRTVASIMMVQQKRARQFGGLGEFAVAFQKCTFVGFEESSVPTNTAVLERLPTPLKRLTLSDQGLTDEQLPPILDRIHQLELLDISFNSFRPLTLLKFLIEINRKKNSEMVLGWISLKGNSLRDKNSLEINL